MPTDSPPLREISWAGTSPPIQECGGNKTLPSQGLMKTVMPSCPDKEALQRLAAFFEILNQINEREKVC